MGNNWNWNFFVVNKVKVFYGFLKELDINMLLEEEDEFLEGEDKLKVLLVSLLNMILGVLMNIF